MTDSEAARTARWRAEAEQIARRYSRKATWERLQNAILLLCAQVAADARADAPAPLNYLTIARRLLEHNAGPVSTPYGEFVYVERADFDALERAVLAALDAVASPQESPLKRTRSDVIDVTPLQNNPETQRVTIPGNPEGQSVAADAKSNEIRNSVKLPGDTQVKRVRTGYADEQAMQDLRDDGGFPEAAHPPVAADAGLVEANMSIHANINEAFEEWWLRAGRFIDPDTSDVPWFDKRKELCLHAFEAATAQSGNYVADDAVAPTVITFANGRVVKSIGGRLILARSSAPGGDPHEPRAQETISP